MAEATVAAARYRGMLLHTHGIGEIDFSSMSPRDLQVVQSAAEDEKVLIIPTIFLRACYLASFERVLTAYSAEIDRYPNVIGFAVEGPLLGKSGGVPSAGCWSPTVDEWLRIARWGALGLRYMVIGPDAMDLNADLVPRFSFRDLIDTFYANGVILALGHFQHTDPIRSAQRTVAVIEYVHESFGGRAERLITDHLFNDMPRTFIHAWRTPAHRARREMEIRSVLDEQWTVANVERLLGPVPATLLRAARADKLTPVLNFDGEHVDLDICRRVVEFLGAERLMAITDNTETDVMAGESLYRIPGSSLKYRVDGLVAAGSCGIREQRRNMRGIGLSPGQVDKLVLEVPCRVFGPDWAVSGGKVASPDRGDSQNQEYRLRSEVV